MPRQGGNGEGGCLGRVGMVRVGGYQGQEQSGWVVGVGIGSWW